MSLAIAPCRLENQTVPSLPAAVAWQGGMSPLHHWIRTSSTSPLPPGVDLRDEPDLRPTTGLGQDGPERTPRASTRASRRRCGKP